MVSAGVANHGHVLSFARYPAGDALSQLQSICIARATNGVIAIAQLVDIGVGSSIAGYIVIA